MARILIVLSGSDHWTLSDGTRHPTGFWAEEFVEPHRTFRHAEVDVDIAGIPGGVRPTVDQVSLAPDRAGGEERAAELRSYLESLEDELAAPISVEYAADNLGNSDAVFIPGGHGPMEDLPDCLPLGRILVDLFDTGRVVAAVCHGPAGLLAGCREDGTWLFAGRRLTAFTNEEERKRVWPTVPSGYWRPDCATRERTLTRGSPGVRTWWWTGVLSPARTRRPRSRRPNARLPSSWRHRRHGRDE